MLQISNFLTHIRSSNSSSSKHWLSVQADEELEESEPHTAFRRAPRVLCIWGTGQHTFVLCCGVRRCSGELKAPWSGKTVQKPSISVTDESGTKAEVTLFNIWAGKVSHSADAERCCCQEVAKEAVEHGLLPLHDERGSLWLCEDIN